MMDRKELTVIVSDVIVEVKLSLDELAIFVGERGSQDVVLLDADVLGRGMERHLD